MEGTEAMIHFCVKQDPEIIQFVDWQVTADLSAPDISYPEAQLIMQAVPCSKYWPIRSSRRFLDFLQFASPLVIEGTLSLEHLLSLVHVARVHLPNAPSSTH